jgi:hypothetical protein
LKKCKTDQFFCTALFVDSKDGLSAVMISTQHRFSYPPLWFPHESFLPRNSFHSTKRQQWFHVIDFLVLRCLTPSCNSWLNLMVDWPFYRLSSSTSTCRAGTRLSRISVQSTYRVVSLICRIHRSKNNGVGMEAALLTPTFCNH